MEGTHTRDKGEKDIKICRSIPASNFLPVFFITALLSIYTRKIRFEWGQEMACAKNGVISRVISVLYSRPQLIGTQVVFWESIFQVSFFRAQISPQPLHLSPTFRHLLEGPKVAIQCMSQVTKWWSGCRDMLAQS
jgi:hypothetical protein